MKKLMIAAATAAMIGGAQAAVCVDGGKCGNASAGTAHKVTISLKTTTLKTKKVKDNCDSCNSTCTYWREQTTKKINGLLWEQLPEGGCEDCVPFGTQSAFWTKDGALDVEFSIGIGLIGKKANSKSIEAYGGLNGDDFGSLAWAGFGSIAGSEKKETDCAPASCSMYVKSITGGIAGQIVPVALVDEKTLDDIHDCDAVVYDGCCAPLELENTAAYGTIKITYDKSTAKKVALAEDADDPASFYKLPAAAADDVAVNEVVIEE